MNSLYVKERAHELGFEACGVARAHRVDDEAVLRYAHWLAQERHGCMEWATRHIDLRDNPQGLLPGAQSVIVVAMNYYPSRFQPQDAPQFAYYAYGRDYHEVVKRRLWLLAADIERMAPCQTRCCVDSAPLRERYWAWQAGLGFIGLNNALILPGRGSYYFLGVILTTLQLEPDAPCNLSCGECRACLRACPAGALTGEGAVDARRCLSCLTIEHRGELPQWVEGVLGNRVFGCDECQKCCPHNRHARPTSVPEFQPSDEFLSLTHQRLAQMDQAEFSRLFSHSAVKRAKLAGLQRNLALCTPRLSGEE